MGRRTRYRPAPVPPPIVGIDLLVRERPGHGDWAIEMFVDGLLDEVVAQGESYDAVAAQIDAIVARHPGARVNIDLYSGAWARAGLSIGRSGQKGSRLRQ